VNEPLEILLDVSRARAADQAEVLPRGRETYHLRTRDRRVEAHRGVAQAFGNLAR